VVFGVVRSCSKVIGAWRTVDGGANELRGWVVGAKKFLGRISLEKLLSAGDRAIGVVDFGQFWLILAGGVRVAAPAAAGEGKGRPRRWRVRGERNLGVIVRGRGKSDQLG